MESLLERIDRLKIAVDEQSDKSKILDLLSSINSDIEAADKDGTSNGADMVDQLVTLLTQWEDDEVSTKAAMTIATLSKSDSGRIACSNRTVVNPLLALLSNRNIEVLIQVCRALANICYENGFTLTLDGHHKGDVQYKIIKGKIRRVAITPFPGMTKSH